MIGEKNMEKILSISVAAYNVEQFIVQNIESFLGTSVSSKIEVLIIDDGSKDCTAQIVKEYEMKYPEIIKLIHQENSGPGSTVNNGIQHANGKYFRMVDGDDWVNTNDLENYIHFLENNDVDVVYTDYYMVDNNTNEKVLQHLSYSKKNCVLNYDDVCDQIDVEMHNVTYKTTILQKNSIVLDNCFYTDLEYLLLPVKYLKTIAVLDCAIYMYRVSLSTQSININSMIKNKKMHEKVLQRLISDYSNSVSKGLLSKSQKQFIKNRIVKMAGTHLSIILAQKASRDTKNELLQFANYLKLTNVDVFNQFMKFRTMKILKATRYLTFKIISDFHRKKQ